MPSGVHDQQGVRQRRLRGELGEQLAADYLVSLGYVQIARNRRVGSREIDIVAALGDLCVLVEVRARSDRAMVGALASIGTRKRQTLIAAAELVWPLLQVESPHLQRVRLDVVAVTFGAAKPVVEHFPGAIERSAQRERELHDFSHE